MTSHSSSPPVPAEALEKIETLLSDPPRARRLLRRALEDAELEAWPTDPSQLDAFVRGVLAATLLPYLRLEQVQRLVGELLDPTLDRTPPPLRTATALSGGVPVDAASAAREGRRARVALWEPEALRRVELSRAFVGASFDVDALETLAALATVAAPHVLVAVVDLHAVAALVRAAKRFTRTGLVALEAAESLDAVRDVLAAWPTDRGARVARFAPAAQVCARVRVVLP